MSKQNFVRVATGVFTVVAVVHLYRAFSDMPVMFGGWIVPVSFSWFVGLLGALLAYTGYRYWGK